MTCTTCKYMENENTKHKKWSKQIIANLNIKSKIFVQKSKFRSKIEILVKNRNFAQKSKFCSKVEILLKSRNFSQNRNFAQKSKFRSKIDILVDQNLDSKK